MDEGDCGQGEAMKAWFMVGWIVFVLSDIIWDTTLTARMSGIGIGIWISWVCGNPLEAKEKR